MRPKAMTWRERARGWLHRNRRALWWWCLAVALFLLAGAVVIPGPLGGLLASGLMLGVLAFLLIRVFLDVNVWRTRRKLTWSSLLGGVFLVWIAWLVLTGPGDWARVRTALLIIGYYAVLIGAGLLVLYLAVRVVRAAWTRPASTEAARDVSASATSQAPVEVVQLILSPQEAWVLAGALATAVAPGGTDDLKGLRARVGILGDLQQYWRTEGGRKVVARLGAKLLKVIAHMEQREGMML